MPSLVCHVLHACTDNASDLVQLVSELTYDSTNDLYTIACNQAYLLPNVTFVVGGYLYDVPGYEWTYPVSNLLLHKLQCP